ncbi:MAG: FAD-dependent oxidoreductase [Alphaproteobacteria bacterium]|nr:FAD-dependent oxidoreductase [Alphaproteobacteria bacterium]
MANIAIIGSGIAGLSAAYLLQHKHTVTLYEKEPRLGGHSRTVTVNYGGRIIPVDTGFIVFNERNYPNLTALFARLGVRVKNSSMTYAFTMRNGWFEWGAKDFSTIFGQRRNLLRPWFIQVLREVMRFNTEVVQRVANSPNITLGQLIEAMSLSENFKRYYLLPISGAIWSCPPQQMLQFPAQVFVNFFDNHSLLSMDGQPQWLTVDGGSQQYVQKLSATLKKRPLNGIGAARVERTAAGARVHDSAGNISTYDHVVFACHSDQALSLLADPSDAERHNLGAIRYQENEALLHKDPRFMPKRRRCWSAWNYHAGNEGRERQVTLTYWMNELQSIDERYPLFVTLNPAAPVADADIFDRTTFHHPVFDTAAIDAQRKLAAMQGDRNTWFCGAYMRHGFHEDGLLSAMIVAERLGSRAPWVSPAPLDMSQLAAAAGD